MKSFFTFVLMGLFSSCLHAQAVDATVCDILKDPASFNGKIVRIKGTVSASFDRFSIEGPDCRQAVNGIWLSYPEGAKGKAGPVAMVEMQPARNFTGAVDAVERTPVTLDKSKDFKQFDSLLATQIKGDPMCLGCSKFKVSGTLVGRLDGVAKAGISRDSAGKIVGWTGFGNMNLYKARLVLQSVSDVTSQALDYAKAAAETKGDNFDLNANGDAVEAAHAAAKVYGPGNTAGDQLERAASAFGSKNDKNGVIVGFKSANEAPKGEDSKGAQDSPDGVLFNCNFVQDRVLGDAMARALVHSGILVAQMRNPLPDTKDDGLYETEYRAWATVSFSAIASKQKTLTVFGGTVIWNTAWPLAERTTKLNEGLRALLASDGLQMQ